MGRTWRFAGIVAWLWVGAEAFAADPPVGPVDVGVARADVTPTYPVRLGGYLARSSETTKVGQKLWAKALAIGSDAQKPVVLVSVDNLGVGEAVVEDVARRLEKKAGIERPRFTVASSHTHSAPCLTGVAPNIFGKPIPPDEQARIDRYTRELADAIERVSLDALAARRPCKLAWAQGRVGFAQNRRTKGGPVDHALPVLKATDLHGKVLGILANYACHCTTLDPNENSLSGDWAGYAQAALEADHPGAVALTVVGCGADANPARRLAPGAAADHGRALADEVKKLLAGTWTDLPGPPETAFERLTLPFDTLPTRAQLEALVKAGGPPGYNASVQLAKLDRGEPLQSRLNYSAQAWRFGDRLAMVFLPGEVVVDYVLRIKKEFDPARLWVTAYANDVPCYIPSERILREGGYEGGGAMVYYARPTRLKPGVEQLIIDAVHKVVPDTFRAPSLKAADDDTPPPKSPRESLAAIRVKPGLRVELVAAEPLVVDPVAVDFGGDGRLWVCEMRDYPTGVDGNWKPGGVVKVLEDRDGDGKYDTGTEFLTGLPFPTGVMAWRKGVLVCAAPDIIYAEDTDGDGKADVKRKLFEGFATENYQARVNGLAYGLDNWVYGANGLIGGSIRGLLTGKSVDIGGRDFRIRPDAGVMEPASGLTQQGRVRDDWNRQFGGNNSVWIQHYPLPDHYARRNPFVAAPGASVYVPRDPDSTRLYPASRTLVRYNHPESANRVTSACSPLVFRDRLLGAGFAGNAFVCEPVHNLVHREVLRPDGVTFAGHRAPEETTSEFLASTDHWFRPVQVRTGPDGALWVVDMYRFVIEHPRWISPERLATLDVRSGADKGRIYRVVPEGQPLRPFEKLDRLDPAALADRIDTPNGTVRDLVQRFLVHRGGRDAVEALRRIASQGKTPEGRAQALGTLDGLGALEASQVLAALADPHAGVRAQAVRLAEPWLDKDPALRERVAALASDPEVTVRFQVALSLGETGDPAAGQALGTIAARDGGDPWVRAAVLSSARPHAAAVLRRLTSDPGRGGALVEPLIATVVGTGDPAQVTEALAAVTRGTGTWRFGAVARLLETSSDASLVADPGVAKVVDEARKRLVDRAAAPRDRAVAVRLLGRVPATRDADRTALAGLLDPAEPVEVQTAAVTGLSRLRDRGAFTALVEHWPGMGPTARAAVLDALLARPESAEILLDALAAGRVDPAAVDAGHRESLLTRGPESQRARARAAFGAQAIGARKAVLDAYASAKTLPGDVERGRAVFGKICAACHKVGETGHEVGPDLAALTDLTPDALLTAILDPNREVDARYAAYNAALTDGRVLTGLIASETATALTLKRQEGQTDAVLRTEIEELRATGKSLMPEGLENDLKPADVADVMAFLARGIRQPKSLEGNRPQLVAATPDGVVRLPASAAEVYGPSLTYETATRNLGYWHAAADQAAWTFQTDRPATYTMTMEWACADESAGNPIVVVVDGKPYRSEAGGTGTWANYRTIFLAEVTLTPGKHRLEFKPAAPPRGAVLDLRAVVLTPRSESVYRAKP